MVVDVGMTSRRPGIEIDHQTIVTRDMEKLRRFLQWFEAYPD
jgi:hypothetical protein